MSELLTQEEIDALLGGVDDFDFVDNLRQETVSEDVQPEIGLRAYDFTRREKIIRGDLMALNQINERFSGFFRKSISGFLGTAVDIEQSAIQVQQFAEFSRGLPLQTHRTIARFSPLCGSALIVMEHRLMFTVIDHYFGGGAHAKNPVEKKEFTPIMARVFQMVLELIFKGLKEAWQPVAELDIDYTASGINPAGANIAEPDEIVLISTNHLFLKGGNGDFTIAMPYSMIEPIRGRLDNPGYEEPDEDSLWKRAFRQQILQAEVNVTGRLSEKQMAIGDVMRLKKGDLIPIDNPESIVLCIQGIPVYKGEATVSGDRNALKIVGRIDS